MIIDKRIRWVERFKRSLNHYHNGIKDAKINRKMRVYIDPYRGISQSESKILNAIGSFDFYRARMVARREYGIVPFWVETLIDRSKNNKI